MNVHAVFVVYADGDGCTVFDLIGLATSEAGARALVAKAKESPEALDSIDYTRAQSLEGSETVIVGTRRQYEREIRRTGQEAPTVTPLILIEPIVVSELSS